ncbi:SMP-30/gluconolactonase/LRE family protein [Herbaspirillum chlorophenolicum]|uniref:SMP-30/gluconolactonase/LRE family protein n=1 Tax=Herbaspirillum chlorophenolicum TaxID=211589 RepID=UPI00067C8B04|nr:SMP-30/gluconolactonase/LRE family protein [Herbaspirillum chlorophenolicum]
MKPSSAYPLPRDYRLNVEDLRVVARGMQRPECVLALENGELLASHGGGGYSRVLTDGNVRHVLPAAGRGAQAGRAYVPNGIALAPDGRVLFADLGAGQGGIFALAADGALEYAVESIEGKPLPPSNYVTVDAGGTLWLTVSTRRQPRSEAWTPTVADGFIAVLDSDGARIVADGLGYTNEIAFSPDGRWVYVNETYAQCVSRFALLPGPALGPREVVARLGGANLPDGLTFDAHGGLWLTCIASNRLLVVRPDGEVQTVLEDTDPEHEALVAQGVQTGTLQHATMQTAGRSRLGNMSSLAFGGKDLRTAYLGCLLDDAIRAFDSPVPGLPTAHWRRTVSG